MCLFLSLCLSASLPLCLSASLSLCLSVSLSLCLSVSLSPCLHVSMSLCLSVPLSLCLFVSVRLCVSAFLRLCVSASMRLGDSRMTTPRQDVFHVWLPRRNRMSSARALEIHFHRATEVQLPYQSVRYKFHYDESQTTYPRPISYWATPCSVVQLCSRASELAASPLEASTFHR